MVGFGQNKIITQVAYDQLDEYLKKIPLGEETMYGFNNREEFSQSKIGIPYEVFTLNSDFFDYDSIQSDRNYIISTENWRVPIIVDSKYKALLTVSKQDKKWSVVSIGAKGLANELEIFEQNHPSLSNRRILRIFQIKGDFILTEQNTIFPLLSASNSILIKYNQSYPIYEILNLIKKNKINYER
jgi:hypothetical protein